MTTATKTLFMGIEIPIRDAKYSYDYIYFRARELWLAAVAVNDSNEYFYGTQPLPDPGPYGYDIYRDSEDYVHSTIDCGNPIPYLNVRLDGKLKLFGDPDMVKHIRELPLWKKP